MPEAAVEGVVAYPAVELVGSSLALEDVVASRPFMVSLPAPAQMTSSPGVPVRVSLAEVPVMVQGAQVPVGGRVVVAEAGATTLWVCAPPSDQEANS